VNEALEAVSHRKAGIVRAEQVIAAGMLKSELAALRRRYVATTAARTLQS
jgi:hypothetical protein